MATHDQSPRGRVVGWIDRVPGWGLVVWGVVTVVVGVLLATRPLTSLAALTVFLGAAFVVLGAADLLPQGEQRTAGDVARGVGWLLLGVLVLAWLRTSFDLLALAVGVVLVLSGGARVWRAVRGPSPGDPGPTSTTARVGNCLLGVAEVVLGVLAIGWPDLTLLTVAVIFAVRLVLLGIRLIRRGLGPRPGATADPRDRAHGPGATAYPQDRAHGPGATAYPLVDRTTARPWLRLTGGALALLLACGAALLAVQARTGSPAIDAFYAAPEEVPGEPGVLLRSERFTRDVPEGATGWRILYTTTAADGSPATASAIVVVPTGAQGPVPVIAWAHGTTGFATQCAPSLLTHPFEAGAMPALEPVVERGWAVVATDYTGLGTPGPQPYLIGPGEGHSVLDGIRAGQQLPQADLSPDTVVWGHSQGGHAALWTGQLAGDYAPELTLHGVAAMAPAADVEAFAESLTGSSVGALFASYLLAAYAAHYPEVTLEEQVIPPARTLVREMSGRCLSEPSIVASVASLIAFAGDRSIYVSAPGTGALGERLRENVPTGPFPMPVLLAQGEADDLILPTGQRAYVDRLCASGASPDYRTYPGRDHVSLVAPESPLIGDLLQWTADRFEGAPLAAGCG